MYLWERHFMDFLRHSFCLIKNIWLFLTPAQFPTDFSGPGVLNWHKSWGSAVPLERQQWNGMTVNYGTFTVWNVPPGLFSWVCSCSEVLHHFHHPFYITLSMPSYSYTKGVLHLDHTHLLQAFNRSHLHKKCGFQAYGYTFIATCFVG